jgi:release factor glutamine methyltransferase
MFEQFLHIHETFNEHDTEHPILETLHLMNILSGGALQHLDQSLREKMDIITSLDQVAQQRKEGVPLEYILEKAVFMGIEFHCTPDTLIPREETELLARVTLDMIEHAREQADQVTVMDIGTGCGNIAISLAAHAAHIRVLASDISDAAIVVAQKNVTAMGLEDRVSLFCGDLFAPLEGQGYENNVDVVVCNPPYIPTSSLSKLAPEIIDHEPRVALDAGTYGINIFRGLIAGALTMLKPGGKLVFEIGAGQEKLVTRLLNRTPGYADIEHFDDGEQVRVIGAVRQ